MNVFKRTSKKIITIYFIVGIFALSCSSSPEIIVQNLQMELPAGEQVFTEELLIGEIDETKIEHIAYVGPTSQTLTLSGKNINMLMFIRGNGTLSADTMIYSLVPESMAIPFGTINSLQLDVPDGEELHFLQFTKKLSVQDMADLNSYPQENKHELFFTRFIDCEPYTEKIKSPNTVSRTVLPADIVPRVALGTVEAPGPDEVGAHKHAMLDQLFLGLTNNEIVVHADGVSATLGEYALLHIPIGSSHWVSVDENKHMYYMWMDFFLTKEGQEWLKTHKPISTDKNEY